MDKQKIDRKAFTFPMPTVLIGTVYQERANFMTLAWVCKVHGDPPMVAVSINKAHATAEAIAAGGAFSVNVPSVKMMAATDYCGLVSGRDADKAGVFDVFYGELDHAPMIVEAPLSLECKLHDQLDLPVDTLFVGEVVGVYCPETLLTDGKPDLTKIKPLVYNSPHKAYFALGEFVGHAWSVGRKFRPGL